MQQPFNQQQQDAVTQARQPMFVLQDRYEVINYLGQGGMGTVFIAQDRRLGRRPCVVKKLRDDFFREEDKEKAMSFFEREALVLSKLRHENIVHILDSFKENDDCYLVMEYVEGENLYQMLTARGEPFPEETVMKWAAQIADVLKYLHTNSVIYRDLKPSNVMLDFGKDCVKLVDFGIARPYAEESDNTHVVSAGYSPPEQYWGAATPQSDLYALGATMYYLLTGEEPLALTVCSPRKTNPDVSELADYIVRRATEQDPALRYEGAQKMIEAIDDWRLAKESKTNQRKTSFVAAALVAASVLAIIAVIAWCASVSNNSAAERSNQEAALHDAHTTQNNRDKLKAEQQKKSQVAKASEDESKPTHPQAVSTNPETVPTAEPKYKAATVSFREVDEEQLTDPEGLQPPPDEQAQ